MFARKVIIVGNPAARRLKREQVERFAGLLRAKSRVEVRWTRAPGVTPDQVELVQGGDLVVAAGGDGTLFQVVNLLRMGGLCTPVAFFPAGTANVFRHEARLPGRAEDLAELILSSEPREYRLGWARFDGGEGSQVERVFLLMAGVGWDARVSREVHHGVKRLHGKGAYVAAGLKLLASRARELVPLSVKGGLVAGEAVVLANSSWYGGPYSLAPQADPGRPCLSLAVVKRISLPRLLRLLRHARRRQADPSGNVVYAECGEAEVREPGHPLQLDGDHVGHTPALFRKDGQSVLIIRGPG